VKNRNISFATIPLALTLTCFTLSPPAQAVCQEGCLTSENTVLGDDALLNTTGGANTAIGFDALLSNTTGSNNTAIGSAALDFNTTGSDNTANGLSALRQNTEGSNNTAMGFDALFSNTTGYDNTATGADALLSNTTGVYNTANGVSALFSDTTGFQNTAAGVNALVFNTTGHDNTANGFQALFNNTTGSSNIALGSNAGLNLTTGSNNIDIGHAGVAGEAKTIRIGTGGTQTKTFIVGISGVAVTGSQVVVNSNGKLGVTASSERFKDKIQLMGEESEAILALQPVTFRYKKELDPEGIPQFGLVAEQVEKVDPVLVARDERGRPFTVRYEAVNTMLLNEFLKEHRKVWDLETTVARQQKEIAALTADLKEQESEIRKVSAQLATGRGRPAGGLEVSNSPAPQMVANNQ